jgi:hypothetical protein
MSIIRCALGDIYLANKSEANARVLDDDRLATAVISLAERGEWSGTATALLAVVNPLDVPGLPRAANQLTRRLKELKPNLVAAGVPIDFRREGHDSQKMISIGKRIVCIDSIDRAA